MNIVEEISTKLNNNNLDLSDELLVLSGSLIETYQLGIRDLSFEIKNINNKLFICSSFNSQTMGNCKDSFELILKESYGIAFENYIEYFTKGIMAINFINGAIEQIQKEKSSLLYVHYKFGISHKFCKIANWDYSNIMFKLSRDSIITLSKLYSSDDFETEIREIIDNSTWADNIADLVTSFNNLGLNCKIEAVLSTVAIEDILSENMLTVDDIIPIIKSRNQGQGIQKFRSVFILKELGKFIALIDWKVDYSKQTINTYIVDEKVLDIENNRFISDPSIYSRIEHRAKLSDDVINLLF